MEAKDRVIVAMDVDNLTKALWLMECLRPDFSYFKVGLELLTSEGGPRVVQTIKEAGGKIFYDGKFADIPAAVAGASKAVAGLRVDMFNVHASAGREAIAEAVANKGESLVLGVTVLTSIDEKECESIFGKKPGPKVLQFAEVLLEAGADGIICSPQELELLGQYPKLKKLLKVTPSARPLWAAVGDQKRVMTPREAILAGADYLVIGRPITHPPPEIGNPADAAKKIAKEIAAAIIERRALEIFSQTKAIITKSHVVYTSGKHGPEYVNKDSVYPNTEATDELCGLIADLFRGSNVEVVVAPVQGGINLSQGVARHLTKMTGRKVLSIYADKEGDGLVLKRGYDKYVLNKRVLAVDDVFTTGGSVEKLVKLVRSLGGEVVGVGGLCNRGGVKSEDIGVVPEFWTLVSVQMASYDEADCPLCKEGVPINTEVGKGKEFLAKKSH